MKGAPQEGVALPITIGAKPENDFSNPIWMLGDCHRQIERFLNVLVAISRSEKGGPITEEQKAALTTSLRYFRDAAPKHTADEEESVFPRLRGNNSPEAQAALERLAALEHDHERASAWHEEADVLGQRWLAEGSLSPEDASRFSTLVENLAQLYREHILVEDTELFPLAANLLSAADRESIGAEMASRRGVHRSSSNKSW